MELREKCVKISGIGECAVVDLKDYDPEDSLLGEAKSTNILVVITSTYTDGQAPPNAAWFYKYVTEAACDFRFQKDALKGLTFAVCGLGNSLYAENFNKVAVELDRSLAELDAQRLVDLCCCDENTLKAKHASLEGDFQAWTAEFLKAVENFANAKLSTPLLTNGCCRRDDATANGCCRTSQTTQNNSNLEY